MGTRATGAAPRTAGRQGATPATRVELELTLTSSGGSLRSGQDGQLDPVLGQGAGVAAVALEVERCADERLGVRDAVVARRDPVRADAARNAYQREATTRRAPEIVLTHKMCPRCEMDKNTSQYGKDTCQADGYDTYCRVCRKEMRKKLE